MQHPAKRRELGEELEHALAFAAGAAGSASQPPPPPARRTLYRRVDTQPAGKAEATEQLARRLLSGERPAGAAAAPGSAARASAQQRAASARYQQVRSLRAAAAPAAAAGAAAESSQYTLYDYVREGEAGEAGEAEAAAARARRVAAAAAQRDSLMLNYLPLVREALLSSGIPFDERTMVAQAQAGPPSAGEDDEFVYDLYYADPGEGPGSVEEAHPVLEARDPDAEDLWEDEAGRGGEDSSESGCEVDYPEDEEGSEAEEHYTGEEGGSGGDSSSDAETLGVYGMAGYGGGARGGREEEEEYDTVAFEEEEEAEEARRRAAAFGSMRR